MKKSLLFTLSLIVVIAMQACISNRQANNYNNRPLINDKGLLFLSSATENSLTITKMSGLPISNSRNQRVIQFAKMMITDYTQLSTDLQKLKTDNFVTTEDSVNTIHQQAIKTLGNQHAAAFDKEYLQQIIVQQQQAVSLFSTAATQNGADVNVADFAKAKLPSLKAQLDSAKAIALTLK